MTKYRPLVWDKMIRPMIERDNRTFAAGSTLEKDTTFDETINNSKQTSKTVSRAEVIIYNLLVCDYCRDIGKIKCDCSMQLAPPFMPVPRILTLLKTASRVSQNEILGLSQSEHKPAFDTENVKKGFSNIISNDTVFNTIYVGQDPSSGGPSGNAAFALGLTKQNGRSCAVILGFGSPIVSTSQTTSEFYGPVLVAEFVQALAMEWPGATIVFSGESNTKYYDGHQIAALNQIVKDANVHIVCETGSNPKTYGIRKDHAFTVTSRVTIDTWFSCAVGIVEHPVLMTKTLRPKPNYEEWLMTECEKQFINFSEQITSKGNITYGGKIGSEQDDIVCAAMQAFSALELVRQRVEGYEHISV